MTKNDRIPALRRYLGEYIDFLNRGETDKNGKPVCPLCGSGSGSNRTSALSVTDNGERWHCFSCGKGGDIVDLCQEVERLNMAEAIDHLSEFFFQGAEVPPLPSVPRSERKQTRTEPEPFDHGAAVRALWTEEGAGVLSYLRGRGFTDTTLRAAQVGAFYYRAGMKVSYSFTTMDGEFSGAVAWRDPHSKEKGFLPGRGMKQADGTPYGAYSVKGADVVFIVEGQADCLSVLQLGFSCLATSSTSNAVHVVSWLKEHAPQVRAIVAAMDGEEAGQRAQETLIRAAQEAGFSVLSFSWDNLPGKDANEALQGDPQGLKAALREASKMARSGGSQRPENAEGGEMLMQDKKNAENGAEAASILPSMAALFDDEVRAFQEQPEAISTGLAGIDGLLRGGLTNGLFLLGAAPAVGKTALALQIADHVAKEGGQVLFISAEMGRLELAIRSLCRLGGLSTEEVENALKGGAEAEKQSFKKALEEYKARIAPGLFIDVPDVPFIEDIGKQVSFFRESLNGKRGLVIVDYLQLLQTRDPQKSGADLTRLAEVSRRLKIMAKGLPVLAVASINRASYDKGEEVNLDAFKGCGDIEFSADAAFCLYREKDETAGGKSTALALKMVKGRRWRLGTATLTYQGENYAFTDAEREAQKADDWKSHRPVTKRR